MRKLDLSRSEALRLIAILVGFACVIGGIVSMCTTGPDGASDEMFRSWRAWALLPSGPDAIDMASASGAMAVFWQKVSLLPGGKESAEAFVDLRDEVLHCTTYVRGYGLTAVIVGAGLTLVACLKRVPAILLHMGTLSVASLAAPLVTGAAMLVDLKWALRGCPAPPCWADNIVLVIAVPHAFAAMAMAIVFVHLGLVAWAARTAPTAGMSWRSALMWWLRFVGLALGALLCLDAWAGQYLFVLTDSLWIYLALAGAVRAGAGRTPVGLPQELRA